MNNDTMNNEQFGRPEIRTSLPGPKAAENLARDRDLISPSYTRGYPFVIARGEGAWAWDVDGNKFLDLTTGIAVTVVGHAHPKVVEAIRDQAGRFIHMSGTDFYYELQVQLAERLERIAPGDAPKRVHYTNSGAESVEAALKLARYETRRPRFLAFVGGFHGRTMGALSLTSSKPIQRRGFAPLVPAVIHVPFAYCYRCPINLTYPDCQIACLDWIEEQVFNHLTPPDEVAAVVVEPIQGENGYIVPPPGFHTKLRGICDRYGILLIADEIQSGMGRTGRWLAMAHWDVVPDIVCLAKGIASGMPLGAIIASRELMKWPPGAHASTFCGNPVACAAAMATLDVIEEEDLLSNAAAMGERLQAGLRALAEEHEVIGDVRGLGLMVGIELVADRETREPAKALRDRVIQNCYERGVLMLGAGRSVIRFMPPLNVTAHEIDLGLEILAEALKEAVA
ncbi:MAG: acetyl ornithine aminotransferase family protein [Anaerolineae bacterium]|nr:acetyl ornithine aminotransferase family protein [Anaerolineae bacterium]